jgi:cytochrome P450
MDPTPFPDFQPERPDFYRGDPDAVFARLRDEDPVHWYEGDSSFWCVTRYADVREVSRRPRLFSSAEGILVNQLGRIQQGGGLAPAEVTPMVVPTIINMDPPQHNLLRKLVIGQFTPAATARLEARVRELARESLAAVPTGERVDFVDAVAIPLPMLVIAELLDVPKEDRDRFRVWSDTMIEAAGGEVDEQASAVIAEMFGYLGEQVEERRKHPREDLISLLLEAEVEGVRLTTPELLMFFMTLLVAGNETTRTLIAGGARALLDHPDELAKLQAKPGLLPNAVEEMLRYVTPLHSFARLATEDTELVGRSIRKGDYLVMFYSAANRDRSVFGADADDFLIGRPSARRHLAFGSGEHLCLGAPLARLEARVMFEELLPRLDGLRYDGAIELLPSLLVNGIEHMPVVFER